MPGNGGASYRNLAYDKDKAAQAEAVLAILKGTPMEEAVNSYMELRGLGTKDADKLTAYFTELSEKTTIEQAEAEVPLRNKEVDRQERTMYAYSRRLW